MSVEISNTEKTQSKTVYTELSVETFKTLLTKNNTTVLLKFGATWCMPCQKIKTYCNEQFVKLPENVLCFDLDIDDNFELFATLKQKKMVVGVPTLLGYYCKSDRGMSDWYRSDISISGSDCTKLSKFFQNI